MTPTLPDRLAPVVRLAPAKLNLTLAVVGRRQDGYHALHSVMVPLGLADRLSFGAVAPPPTGRPTADTLHVAGFDTRAGADDLVLRAIAAARDAVRRSWSGAPAPPPPLAVRLEKRIPVSAGLGGGSSDAAAALLGAIEAWAAAADPRLLETLAARLGSDVPFFLADGPALVEGRGERVTPLPAIRAGTPGVLLVTPPIAVSTARVFAAFAAGAVPGDPGAARRSSVHLAEELASEGLSPAALVARAGVLALANDLVPATAVVEPRLPALRRSLRRLLGLPVGQTGSGPTLWVLYPSAAAAEAAAAAVAAAIDDGRLDLGGLDRPIVAATTLAGPPLATKSRERPDDPGGE